MIQLMKTWIDWYQVIPREFVFVKCILLNGLKNVGNVLQAYERMTIISSLPLPNSGQRLG